MTTMPDPSPPQPAPPPAVPVIRLSLPQSPPILSYTILAINILIFASGWLFELDVFFLENGAKINEAIIDGQVWRLVTAMFLHVDLIHLLFNSYALYAFGPRVEQPYGTVRFLLIYVMSGIAGNALSFLLSPYPSVGASGSIFGLVGVMGSFLYLYRNRLTAGKRRLANIATIVAYNLFYGFTASAVDNWAHIGGLLAGLVLGWLMAPNYQPTYPEAGRPPQLVDQSSTPRWLLGIAAVGVGIGLAIVGGMIRWGY